MSLSFEKPHMSFSVPSETSGGVFDTHTHNELVYGDGEPVYVQRRKLRRSREDDDLNSTIYSGKSLLGGNDVQWEMCGDPLPAVFKRAKGKIVRVRLGTPDNADTAVVLVLLGNRAMCSVTLSIAMDPTYAYFFRRPPLERMMKGEQCTVWQWPTTGSVFI
jgi:hypothetical protein